MAFSGRWTEFRKYGRFLARKIFTKEDSLFVIRRAEGLELAQQLPFEDETALKVCRLPTYASVWFEAKCASEAVRNFCGSSEYAYMSEKLGANDAGPHERIIHTEHLGTRLWFHFSLFFVFHSHHSLLDLIIFSLINFFESFCCCASSLLLTVDISLWESIKFYFCSISFCVPCLKKCLIP